MSHTVPHVRQPLPTLAVETPVHTLMRGLPHFNLHLNLGTSVRRVLLVGGLTAALFLAQTPLGVGRSASPRLVVSPASVVAVHGPYSGNCGGTLAPC